MMPATANLFKLFGSTLPSLGIVSGAGPEAGATLYKIVAREFQANGAWRDEHFPFINVVNFPFPEMLEGTVDKERVSRAAHAAIDYMFSHFHSNYVVIACNTLHAFLKEKQPDNFINLVSLTSQAIPVDAVPLVFASKTSVKENLHGKLFGREVEYFDADKSQALIDAVLAGEDPDLSFIEELAKTRVVVLGCTEYSAALCDSSASFIDPLRLVAKHYFQLVEKDFAKHLLEVDSRHQDLKALKLRSHL